MLCIPAATFSEVLVSRTGFFALVVSAAAVAAAVYQGADLTYIHSHFLQLTTASFLISVLLSAYLYVRSGSTGPDERALGGNSGESLPGGSVRSATCGNLCSKCLNFLHTPGNLIYDFFKGRELNPRIKDFDLKFFCEMRPGLIGWVSSLEMCVWRPNSAPWWLYNQTPLIIVAG